MALAISMAEKSRGICHPNPFVGAVIVKKDRILATGNTQVYGGDHAETVALKAAGKSAKGADLYVSLEPCSHYGKTPPCTKAIIAAGIKSVFLGITDPNPLVNGKGIAELRAAGLEVSTGHMADKIQTQLESFICHIIRQRPFVIWKTALSLDGKYAAQDGSSRWITNPRSRTFVHKLREGCDAVLTGINTVLCDDPLLTVRLKHPRHQPIRIILDPLLEIPLSSKIVQTAKDIQTIVFHSDPNSQDSIAWDIAQKEKQFLLSSHGLELIPIQSDNNELLLDAVLLNLHQKGISSLLLECGSILSSSFFRQGLVDKCHIFYGNILLGGDRAMLSQLPIPDIKAAIKLENITLKRFTENILITGYPVFPS